MDFELIFATQNVSVTGLSVNDGEKKKTYYSQRTWKSSLQSKHDRDKIRTDTGSDPMNKVDWTYDNLKQAIEKNAIEPVHLV